MMAAALMVMAVRFTLFDLDEASMVVSSAWGHLRLPVFYEKGSIRGVEGVEGPCQVVPNTVVVGSGTAVVERRAPLFCLVRWLPDMIPFDHVSSWSKYLLFDVSFEYSNSLRRFRVFDYCPFGLRVSRAKFILAEETTGVTFNDFAGLEYIKRELQEIVRILKNEEEFQNKGIYCPKGVIFHGPPGTGKTLFAKAIAGEAGPNAEASFEVSRGSWMLTGRSRGCWEKAHAYYTNIFFKRPFARATSLSNMIEARLIRNIDQLENAYFTMKSQSQLSDSSEMGRTDKDLLQNRERWLPVQKKMNHNPDDRLRMFFDGLCKYVRYSTFKVRGTLKNADLLNSANEIFSLIFDWDEDFFAAPGVSKKIKIFHFHYLLDDYVDIHYLVIELLSKSKLSCICWNSYIKNYLASTDYDGVVQRKSVGTIRNVANICCVQFSTHSANLLAFGSGDYKTYCYDLRNTKPLVYIVWPQNSC
ncbi:hypothetical protein GIB67_029271 [Kingdonia uniflora]|uniref:ATPase AAA-type core domain-containing protein n=1 Tax=Kingdonia uniflora TaxID=39325 RepID=A0A7J7N8S3_9MAGN|nr:hypothetical protein GIB67_029271 [Kingdonia uniflora]